MSGTDLTERGAPDPDVVQGGLRPPETHVDIERPFAGTTVLVVDDDPGWLESTSLLLHHFGARVHNAATGMAALGLARAERLDLALLDYRLPDMSGLDVGKAFRAGHVPVPWVLVSAFMTYDVAADAGRLGALRAISSPYDVEAVVRDAFGRIAALRAKGWPRLPTGSRLRDFHSIREEFACLIWRVCDSRDDVRTVADWAHAVGKGYSTLRALSDRAGVEPHAAKDFARVLRGLARTGGRVASLPAQPYYGDDRTFGALLERAGMTARSTPAVVTFEDYLIVQRFMPPGHPLLAALKSVLVSD